MTEESLDPRVVTLWRLQALVRLALFWLPASGALAFFVGRATEVWLGALLAGALALTNAVLALLWPALEYRQFGFVVREHDLLVRQGVLFRQWSSIPHRRIQHVDTHQGPLERTLGLARLQVFTAAGIAADGSIPGLDETRANALRDELSRRGGDPGV
jgi:membrane protein YdbS with pleckstrin-like domain